ncbi:MAG: GAF domain-containing sensor histidine kinase [Salinimicrobium sp.]
MPNTQFSIFETSSVPEEFEILKSAPEKDYQDILFLATQICKTKAAAICIVQNGRPWCKTSVGISSEDITKAEALWKIPLQDQKPIQVRNLQEDTRFVGDFGNYQFYAGMPLITTASENLGVLMLFDPREKELDSQQEYSLKILAGQVLNLVTFRKQKNEYGRIQQNLEQRYADLEKFASVVSHDIKSPLANIISLTELLKEENADNFDEATRQYIDYLSQASQSLRSYVDGLLVFYRSEKILEKEEEDVDLKSFFEKLVNLYGVEQDVEIIYPQHGRLRMVNKLALTQIFMNLISNALKYNNKERRLVEIVFNADESFYYFEVKDNGNGIPQEDFERIFDLFTTLDHEDRDGNPGSGIGLATVKKMLHHMGGDIDISSTPGQGSNFKMKIKRSC